MPDLIIIVFIIVCVLAIGVFLKPKKYNHREHQAKYYGYTDRDDDLD